MADRADFAPELGALKSLRPFVFWAQTTLPTVFDDSLSYYEVLTKLCKMVNTMLENEDTNAENITALAEAYQELEDFTNNYFENLDVTQEINDKLDELVADGTIGGYVVERASTLVNNYLYGEDGESGVNKDIEDLISDADTDIENALSDFAADSSAALTNFNTEKTTLMNDLRDDIDNALDEIPTTVNAWLDDNITQPSSTVIDSSLTLHDAAAEAYATGDAINQARNVALANTDYQSFVTDDIPNQYVTAAYDGTNARIATDSSSSPLRPMKIANVVEGETYLISCVGSIIGPTQFCPAYAFVEKTEDLQGNIVRTIVDIYPRSWTEQDQYEIIRSRYITIPDIASYTINEIILMSNTDIAVDATCTRLNVKTDTSLTSITLPAQGKATGDALDTKIPWPVTGGSKDVGTAGKRLASNGDGTTSWADESGDYDEEIENLQNDVADLKSALNNSYSSIKTELPQTFRIGGIESSTGYQNSNSNRAHAVYVKLESGAKYTCTEGYEFVAFEYNLNQAPGVERGQYVGVKINSFVTEYIAEDDAAVIFVIRKEDNSAIDNLSSIKMYISSNKEYTINGYIENGIAKDVTGSIIHNTVIVGSSANVSSNSNYSTTDFIEVSEGDVLFINASVGGSANNNNTSGLYGYDTNKSFVSVLANQYILNGWTIWGFISDALFVTKHCRVIVPSGISYVRLSSRTNGTDSQIPVVYKIGKADLTDFDELKTTVGTKTDTIAWALGSLNNSGQETIATNRVRTSFIDISDSIIHIETNGQKLAYCLYDSSSTFLLNSGWKQCDFPIEPVGTAKYVRFVVAKEDDSSITINDVLAKVDIYTAMQANDSKAENPINGFTDTPFNQTIKIIMHRGYNSIAPENTIPAFKLARKMGFSAIETDIQLTSDNVPVILHDSTVNRTSNGTGNIYDMTLAQAEALDFGSWKSSMYAGTKIPTFEEMLLCCKKIGLDVYIEIKRESPWTQAIMTDCVNTVRKCGMRDHVTWISFDLNCLQYVRTADSKARLGFLMTTYTTEAVDTCVSLETTENEVLAVTRYDLLSDRVLNYMVEKNIPLCAYLFDKCSDADAMQSYVTEALTNEFNASKYIYEQNI